jgi:hypothetical protein
MAEDAERQPRLLAGMLTREQLRAETGWGDRTIQRREAEGLPVVKIGRDRFYPAKSGRDWLLNRVRRNQAPPAGAPAPA